MRKLLLTLTITLLVVASVFGEKKVVLAPSYAWQLDIPLGLRTPVTIDTIHENYAQRFVPSMGSDAWATTGNYGAEGLNMIWMDRPLTSDFFFKDAIERWLPTEKSMVFYNTRAPMTLMSYNTAGGRDNTQDHLGIRFSGNINRKAQIGVLLDYVHSKGCYEAQADKNLVYGISGSYMGDRYEFQGFYNHFNSLNKENGGITDSLYILDPALVQGGVSKVDPKSIPTHLSNAHTRLKGHQLLMNHRYKVGFWKDSIVDDSVVAREYVPVTSFFWNMDFSGGKHLFRDDSPTETEKFFEHTYLNDEITTDRSAYSTVRNTVGISLLEGFHKYAKFGMAAFVKHEYNRFTQTIDTLTGPLLTPFPEGVNIPRITTEHNIFVGGQISKQRGAILTYNAIAEIGVSEKCAGEMEINGNVTTRIPIFGDTLSVEGFGRFTNLGASFFMENYLSNHFIWQNKFDKERQLRFGGSIGFPKTHTHFEVEASNIDNHIYFNNHFLPTQHSGSVQVFSARLKQNLKLGVLNWDNRITYQKSSNQAVIPLPELAIYSNLYLKFKIATLFVQFGVDCNYYTSYYAPRYQPATVSFANQHEQKIGNYPFMNAYANLKLGKTRFYVMMSHVNQGWFSNDYFSMPSYPLNPRRLQLGLSIDFTN